MSNNGEKACPQCGKGVKPALLKCSECGYRFSLQQPQLAASSPIMEGSSGHPRVVPQSTLARQPATRSPGTMTSSGPRIVNGKTILTSGPRVIGASRSAVPSLAKTDSSQVVPMTTGVEATRIGSARPKSVETVAACVSPATATHADASGVASTPKLITRTDGASEVTDLIVVTCGCGASFRVKPEWVGRRRKCTQCSQPLLVPQTNDSAADDVADRLALDDEIKAAIRKLEASPQAVTLKKTVSALALKKLEKQLSVVSVFSEVEAQQRRLAVLELGRTHDVRAWDLIQRCFVDDFGIVRAAVAQAIAELPDRRGLPTLLQLLCDKDEGVVNEAMRAMKAFPESLLVRPLLRVGLSNPLHKLHAAEVLGAMGHVITPMLLDVVQRRDRGMLLDAVVLLGRMGDEAAVPVLLDALSHTSGPLRAFTIEALGRIGDKRATGAMIALLDDPDEIMQLNAMMALERVADARAVKPLLLKLDSDSPELRRRAIMALGRTGDARASEAIAARMPTASDTEREAILETLCAIGDESAAGVLLPLLAEPIAEQQRLILGWARRVKPTDIVEHLLPIIRHSAVMVRKLVADILGDYDSPNSVQALRELATDLAADVRAAALKSLAKTSKSQALPYLEKALRDEASVRVAAVIGISLVNDQRSLPALMAMLRDGLPEVRYHAVKSIGKFGAKQAEAAIKPLLEDPEELVRAAAHKAFEDLGLEVPQTSALRGISRRLSGLLPDMLAGAMPGKTLVMGAVILLAVGLGGWFLMMAPGLMSGDVLAAATGEVVSIAATSDSQLAVWSTLGTVKLQNVDDGQTVHEAVVGRAGRFVSFGPQATLVALVDRKVVHWNSTVKGESALGPSDPVPMGDDLPRISGDGQVLLSKFGSDYITWSLAQHKRLAKIPAGLGANPVLTHYGEHVLALSKDGRRLVLFSAATGEEAATVLPEVPAFREFAMSPDGKRIVGTTATEVYVVDVESQQAQSLNVKGSLANFHFVSPDVVVGCRGLIAMQLNLQDNKLSTWHVNGDVQLLRAVSLAKGQKLAVFGTDDNDHGFAWLIDTTSGEMREIQP